MNDPGFSLKKYLHEILDTEEKRNREITRLDEEEMVEYKRLLKHLEQIHDKTKTDSDKKKKTKATDKQDDEYNTYEIGKALENLVSYLLEKSGIFEIYENIRSSTNEIDQLLMLNFRGKMLKEFIDLPVDQFLSECKNYQGKISVTWVGKFFSLLQTNQTKIGLLFSYHGLAGSGWSSAVGLVKKLFLLKEKLDERTYIIDINIADFSEIAKGHSLLEIVHAKMKALKLDTKFTHFITKHPAEEENEEQLVDECKKES
jgi:hypothetical protein